MPTKQWPITKDTATRLTPKDGNGGEEHLFTGKIGSGGTHISLLEPTLDWDNVVKITKAELVLTGSTSHNGFGPSMTGALKGVRIVGTWSEGAQVGEGKFSTAQYQHPATVEDERTYCDVTATQLGITRLDVTKIVNKWAPSTVKTSTGAAGSGAANRGIRILASGNSTETTQRWATFCSSDHPNPDYHPYIELTYETTPDPGFVTQTGPASSIPDPSGEYFQGTYTAGEAGDKIARINIRLYKWLDSQWKSIWERDLVAPASASETNQFSIPLPDTQAMSLLMTSGSYQWDVRVKNNRGVWTPFTTPRAAFSIATTPPTVDVQLPNGTYSTLNGVYFYAGYSDPQGQRARAWRIQVKDTTTPGDPAWDDGDYYWDTSDFAPTRQEMSGNYLKRLYHGVGLPPGSYSFRIRAEDYRGGQSDWDYGTFTLTDGWQPDPGSVDYLTGYARRDPRFRILIKQATATGRGPATKPVAIIEQAAYVGASEMYNDAGEFFFTLPATHPQVSVIEPWQVHYSLEFYRGEGWKEMAAGLITDFDATEDEVVFYGIDYVGLLSLLYDDRFNPKEAPDKPVEQGGSKYVDWAIKDIISDQLTKAKNETDSIVGFINVGTIDPNLVTEITVFSTFKNRLDFIRQLIESSRAGTGARTRLRVSKSIAGVYSWEVTENPGTDRDNIKFEYGGLVQGFRAIPFANEFGTRVHAIGRSVNGTQVDYHVEQAPNISETTYGRIPVISLWPDVADLNDLKRRAKQMAMRIGKVGKRVALGIRVGSFDVKDGWDVTDSVIVDIKRGVVDTSLWGSGYWTIWGWAWTLDPDGHADLTLSVLPREDETAPDPNLIPSAPILATPEWQVGYGFPDSSTNSSHWYVDTSTGNVWEKQDDGTWADTGESLVTPTPGVVAASWDFSTSYGVAPFSGQLTFDQAPGAGIDATLYISETDRNGANYGSDLGMLRPGDGVTLKNPANNWTVSAHVRTDPVDIGTYWTIPLRSYNGYGTLPPNLSVISTTFAHRNTDNDIPPAPTSLAMTSESTQQAGENFVTMTGTISWGSGEPDDLDYSIVQATRYELPGTNGDPDWTRATSLSIDAGQNSVTFEGIAGNTQYWARTWAVDLSGNKSGYTLASEYPFTTALDDAAPTIPVIGTVRPGLRALAVTWGSSGVADLRFYQVRWSDDAGANWLGTENVYATTYVITGLTPDVEHTVEVRAVDVSGNVDDGAGNAVDYLSNPEAGWSDPATGTPTLVHGDTDLVAGSISTNSIEAGAITTATLAGNTISVKNDGDFAQGFEVLDTDDTQLGLWDWTGITIWDPNDATRQRFLRLEAGEINMYRDGTTPNAAITPDGIDASAITFGTAQGGNNLIPNSSYELSVANSVPITKTHTDTTSGGTDPGNWSNTQTSNTNVAKGTELSVSSWTS